MTIRLFICIIIAYIIIDLLNYKSKQIKRKKINEVTDGFMTYVIQNFIFSHDLNLEPIDNGFILRCMSNSGKFAELKQTDRYSVFVSCIKADALMKGMNIDVEESCKLFIIIEYVDCMHQPVSKNVDMELVGKNINYAIEHYNEDLSRFK